MKNKITLTLLLIVFITVLAVPSLEAAVSVNVDKVEMADISQKSVVNGRIVPAKTISIPSKINAEVRELNIEMGQYVEKGEELIVFDNEQIKSQYKQAKASLEMAKAQHELLLKGASEEDLKRAEESYKQALASYKGAKKSLESIKKVYNEKTSLKQQLNNVKMQMETAEKQWESAKKRYEQSELSLEQVENNFGQAEKEYNRMKNLYKDGVVTQKQFEGAESQYKNARIAVQNAKSAKANAEIALEQAKISYEGAKESYRLTEKNFNDPTELKQQLDSAETQVEVSRANMEMEKENLEKVKNGAREEEKKSSLAQVKQAEASFEQAKLRLEDTIIESPISGFIANVKAEEGQFIPQGSSLINIVKLDPVYVQVGVSSDVLVNIEKGEEVEVELLDYKNELRKGLIETISPVRDQQSQLYTVKVKVNNKDNKIKAGMFADVYFTLNSKEKATVIPADSVIDLDGNPYVFVEENGKAIKKEIKVGLINNDKVEVLEGIKSGENIIVQGHKSLQNGDNVEVVNR